MCVLCVSACVRGGEGGLLNGFIFQFGRALSHTDFFQCEKKVVGLVLRLICRDYHFPPCLCQKRQGHRGLQNRFFFFFFKSPLKNAVLEILSRIQEIIGEVGVGKLKIKVVREICL